MSTSPRLAKPIKLAENTINRGDLLALAKWLTRGPPPRLTQGPLVRKFEEAWAKWLGRRFAVFCNSGSSANLLAYAALGVKGRKVIAPAVSWPTSVAPVIQLGGKLHLRDARVDTWGLEISGIDSSERVCVVDVLGVPTPRPLSGFLLEDCCGAHGSTQGGRKVGTFGEVSTFSFYFGHAASTVEGGMVCTDSTDLCEQLLMLREHGWTAGFPPDHKELQDRAEERFADLGENDFRRKFTFYVPGFNLRGTDLQAFIGLRQLKRLDSVVAHRVENDLLYRSLLEREGLEVQLLPDNSTAATIAVGVLARSPEHRRCIAVALRAAQVETRPIGGGNMARQPFLRFPGESFPVADRIHDCGFQLPNGPHISKQDIRRVVDVVVSTPESTAERGTP